MAQYCHWFQEINDRQWLLVQVLLWTLDTCIMLSMSLGDHFDSIVHVHLAKNVAFLN